MYEQKDWEQTKDDLTLGAIERLSEKAEELGTDMESYTRQGWG